jgi:protein-tyrosine phosphatase
VRWRVLYRSDRLHKLTKEDLKQLSALGLHQIVDFRSAFEKEMEPYELPVELGSRVVEIPILDDSTRIFRGTRKELVTKLKQIDAAEFLTRANVEFASQFTPEMQQFMKVLIASQGRPILFHCTAGKDRTGFAAAVLLRILGVPHNVVLEDYLLTNDYLFATYRRRLFLLGVLRGRRFASVVRNFMLAQPAYLAAAFDIIDRNHGSFENYVRNGLGLTRAEIDHLKSLYLE